MCFSIRNRPCEACEIVSEVSLTRLLDAKQLFFKAFKIDLMQKVEKSRLKVSLVL